jgi:hypothetical protein
MWHMFIQWFAGQRVRVVAVGVLLVQDKAALLATMEPDAVARLLGCMDPNEAVLLLSALGDGTSKLVSNHLTSEDRDRLVEVRRMGLI